MKVLISGSHEFDRLDHIPQVLTKHFEGQTAGLVVVTGGGEGVDAEVEKWAKLKGVKVETIPADFTETDKAPVVRQAAMAESADRAIIFWNGESANTLDLICRCEKRKGMNVLVYIG